MNIDPALFQENERLAAVADERQYADVGALDCEAGGRLESVTVAYETWGELSANKDNAFLICHALSGDSHAVGWWDRLVGPDKPIDTNKYFVISTNALGGCQGTTGPSSLAADGNPYGSRFPMITIGDMVEVQARLMDRLGIQRLYGAAGGSMGGMQALEWALRFPGRVTNVWLTASCAAHSAMQIGFNEAARQAVMRDPKWKGGDYAPDDPPADGLAVSRMIGHLSFLSEAAFDSKFARRLQDKSEFEYSFTPEFQVESYLSYQGNKFTKRFDANSVLFLTRAIDYFDRRKFGPSDARFLITSFSSDWLYPPHQSQELLELAQNAGCYAEWHNIDLPYGHDAFLLDGEHQGRILREFLRSKEYA
ncbi:MAG: homoserine O-acetyltransferase [Fimbriimonadaceae bacterium]|nr:homoserine O-acetyltransferase [Fimbriimonadaceae bacterium]